MLSLDRAKFVPPARMGAAHGPAGIDTMINTVYRLMLKNVQADILEQVIKII